MRRLVPLIALLAVLGGCGDDDDKPGRTVTAQSGETLDVTADEYEFDPETIILRGGEQLTVALKNDGVLAHNLRVIRNGDDLGGTPTFTGGKTGEGTVIVEQGTYELVCTVGNHADLGMVGKLEVK